jgi:hypothetical protein
VSASSALPARLLSEAPASRTRIRSRQPATQLALLPRPASTTPVFLLPARQDRRWLQATVFRWFALPVRLLLEASVSTMRTQSHQPATQLVRPHRLALTIPVFLLPAHRDRRLLEGTVSRLSALPARFLLEAPVSTMRTPTPRLATRLALLRRLALTTPVFRSLVPLDRSLSAALVSVSFVPRARLSSATPARKTTIRRRLLATLPALLRQLALTELASRSTAPRVRSW